MQLSRELLDNFHELSQKVKDLDEIASEGMRTVKDRFQHRTHKLIREGKEIELTEKTLWDEVFYLGEDSQAGEILKKLHPQVFENYRLMNIAAENYKKFSIVEMGVDASRMNMSDQMKMVEAMVEFKLGGGMLGQSNWLVRAARKLKNWIKKHI
jgi:hypothetical protein